MKALSIRQPWAWFIIHAGKDIENRSWRTNYRGRVWVHASKGMTLKEWKEAWWYANSIGTHQAPWPRPTFENIERGGIIGTVEIVDCLEHSDSPWFQWSGSVGFVLCNPKPLPFTPCRGSLGFFDPPQDIQEKLKLAEIAT